MVAQVIVADAGMLVNNFRRFVYARRVDVRGNEARRVAKAAGVEDGADLADDPVGFELPDASDDFGFIETESGEGAFDHRDVGLQAREKLSVVHEFCVARA